MPHISVKMYPGKSEAQKQQLATEIVKDFVELFGYGEESISVAIEEVGAADWKEKIYEGEIMRNPHKLYKKPGYVM
jgi:4-oxalocrotonate tautomerase